MRRGLSPVRVIPGDAGDAEPEDGLGLCLSGGGYRAMLFHAGALVRLAETGLLARVDRVSAVSGGAVAAAVLGLAWPGLDAAAPGAGARVRSAVVAPLARLAASTADVDAVLIGLAGPGSINDRLAGLYRERLLGRAALADLPEAPRIILNATSLQTGELVLFDRAGASDHRVGHVSDPPVDLAAATAASSAFPPVLSPAVLHLAAQGYSATPGADLGPAYLDPAVLSDGGVYDNLGLEAAWKRCRTVLVSDAGGVLAPDPRPPRAWPGQTIRVLKVLDHQVRALRKRQVIGSLAAGLRDGAYWGIRSHLADFPLPDPLPCPPEATLRLAEIPTRLAALDPLIIERLVNWGYAACDAGVRAHVLPAAPRPDGFPYPAAGVG